MSDIIMRIRHYRTQHGMSQEQLARRVGVSRQALIAIEQGASKPSLPVVLAIMRVFDLPFHELFEREGIRFQSVIADTSQHEDGLISSEFDYKPLDINLYERADVYLIEADLAGVKEEDVTINLGTVHIAIFAVRRRNIPAETRLIVESIWNGSLLRIISLPSPIDVEQAETSLRDGLLKITLPKNNAAVVRTIKFKKETHGPK